jgi:PAS domain-containing protein
VLLAFGFATPWLLWGLLLAGVPIVIQWLHRRQYRRRVWAAMRYLRVATESQRRRLQMESLLLLCLRILLVVLAVIALAQPLWDVGLAAPGMPRSRHTLLVLDGSLSMQAAASDGRTLFDRAKDTAREFVRQARSGDSFQLLLIGASPEAVVRQPAFSTGELLTEISRLTPSQEFGEIAPALTLAGQLLEGSPGPEPPVVILISDFQKANWQPSDPAASERTRREFSALSRQAALLLFPVGTEEVRNLTVLSVAVEPGLVTIGTPARVTARIRNFTLEPWAQVPVQLVEDQRVLAAQAVDIPARGEASVVFQTTWSAPLETAVELRIAGDDFPLDNSRWVAVTVKDAIHVLLVNGRDTPDPLARATDFVELALTPPLSDGDTRLPSDAATIAFRPQVVSEAEFARTELEEHDCIVLCDVPFLSRGEAERLKRFAESGSGVILALGEQAQPDVYNEVLGELCGVRLQSVVRGDGVEDQPFHFAEPRAEHPVTATFAHNPRSGFTTASVYRYMGVQVPADSAADVVVAWAHGPPAILEHPQGLGRILLVTTSLDDRWGNWALWPSFLPLMHRLVEYAAAGNPPRTPLVGEPCSVRLSRGMAGQELVLVRPDGRRTTMPDAADSHGTEVPVRHARQQGVYRLQSTLDASAERVFVVNVDPRECDLGRVEDHELLTWGGSATVTRQAAASIRRSEEPMDAGSSRVLLAALVTLLFVEQIMSWNARAGLVALGVLPAWVLTLQWLPAVLLPWFVGLSLLAAAGLWWRRRAWK